MNTGDKTETEKTSLVGRGKGFLKILATLLAVIAAGAWIALGIVVFLMEVPKEISLTIVVVAAVATEVLFWTVAALLGLSVVEARKRIWRRLTRRKDAKPSA